MPYAVATREPARARAFLGALEPLGLTGLAMPVTASLPVEDLRPLAAALAALAPGDSVALASVRASELVAERLQSARAALPTGISWWAVGESSAAPLRRLGLAVTVAPRSSAVGLAEAMIAAAASSPSSPGPAASGPAASGPAASSPSSPGPAASSPLSPQPADLLAGRRVLLPRAEEGRDEAALALRAAGARVDELVVYRTVPVSSDEPAVAAALARWLAGEVAVAALFAPSQVAALQRLLAGRGLSLSAAPTLFAAIGETTAQALRDAGVPHLVVAQAPTPKAMVNAVASRYPPER